MVKSMSVRGEKNKKAKKKQHKSFRIYPLSASPGTKPFPARAGTVARRKEVANRRAVVG